MVYASDLPLRLVTIVEGRLQSIDPRDPFYAQAIERSGFDIISYTWRDPIAAYQSGIEGVYWDLTIKVEKLRDIQRLLECGAAEDVADFMWVDCLCINQTDQTEKSEEIAKMYHYYRAARKCHILIDMDAPWDTQKIIDDLQIVGHVVSHMKGSAVTSESKLTSYMTSRLATWATDEKWLFPMSKSDVRATGTDLGLLNCYSTCCHYVRTLFDQHYFTRVWTFEEMLLGKNITMWAVSDVRISSIGPFDTWMNLAADCMDKAVKLLEWIQGSREVIPIAVEAIIGVLEDDILELAYLKEQVNGIDGARKNIITGGPNWWVHNTQGITGVFSAIALQPRSAYNRVDVFRGLLGLFHGLFTPDEIKKLMATNDMETISFEFFKQLSVKTEHAWTRLAISSGERGQWDWIPVLANANNTTLQSTDCFAGVVDLGHLRKGGVARSRAVTGVEGAPREYMTLRLRRQENRGFRFSFKGCNCGKKIKTGFLKSEAIPTNTHNVEITKDDTGRTLVHCAMILGAVLDPGCDLKKYREDLLKSLRLDWTITDPNAKPGGWYHRTVKGTDWYQPGIIRSHNMSVNYLFKDITECGSRLESDSTRNMVCEIRVNCGCIIVCPFSWAMEALSAVSPSLGKTTLEREEDGGILIRDGLGLVQVGDVDKGFKVVAFGGNIDGNASYAKICRRTVIDEPAFPKGAFPIGRALVPDKYSHSMMTDYAYVPIKGNGNLLISRGNPLSDYKIIGVCIDDQIANKKGLNGVSIK